VPFRLFRRAAPAGQAWNAAKTLAQIAFMWSAALWVVPQLILAGERGLGLEAGGFAPWPRLGLGFLVLCSLGGLWSAWVINRDGDGTPLPMDTTRRLVVGGPYAYVRNPMAITGVGQGLSVGLMLGSPGVVLYALAGALLWNFWMRALEERDMSQYFGPVYEAYRRAVPCWIPRKSPYHERAEP
jgi:protein-S-isoprenylcysteine O-methyltransferase Ste14